MTQPATTHQKPIETEYEDILLPQEDSLLGCLAIILRLERRPRSREALLSGLPLVENRLTPELFLRAAEKAGLAAQVVKKSLRSLSPLTLPLVVLLKDRQAAVVTGIQADQFTLVFPENPEGERTMPRVKVEALYEGQVIFVQPTFRFDDRTKESPHSTGKSWFWGPLARFWPIYAESMAASLMINLFTLASPLFIMNIYDRVVPNNAKETLWVLAIGAAVVYGFDFVIRTLRGYFLDVAGKKADILMASAIFERVNGMQMAFQPASTGAMAKNLMEFETLRDFFTSATLTTLIDLPFVLIFFWVIHYLAGPVVWAPVVAAALVILMGLVLQWPLGHVVRMAFKEASQKHAILVEALSSLETIKTLRAEGIVQGKWEQVVGLTAQSGLLSRFISSLAMNVSILAQQMAVVGVVVSGVYAIGAGDITTGALVASTILTGRALAPLSQVVGLLVRLQQSMVSLTTLNRIMSMPVERPQERIFPSRPHLSGDLAFRDVVFTYPGQPQPAINGLSLTIQAGERVAIIGRVGSGKSTLLRLLLNLYTPEKGAVLADGVDLRQIDPVDLRRNMGFVGQEPVLFFGTLKENLLMADPFALDESLLRAAQLGGLASFVNRHPHGFNRMIGERGRGLSGGQRQAVALSRAILTDPPMLLMDEPTSAMDSGSEERFKGSMATILPGKTLILVTHKASLLSMVDRVVVMEEGRVVADGPRDRVLQTLAQGRLREGADKLQRGDGP